MKMFDSSWKDMSSLPSERKDEIGINYLRYIIGANMDTLGDFLQGVPYADKFVGERHGGIEKRRDDYSGFWDSVLPLLPHKYTSQQIDWLKKKSEFRGVLNFLMNIDPPFNEQSTILRKIGMNMHVYK